MIRIPSASEILPHLKPIRLYLDVTKRQCQQTKEADRLIFSYKRSVALDRKSDNELFWLQDGEIMFATNVNNNEFATEYPALMFSEADSHHLNFRVEDAETFDCVYDIDGPATEITDTKLTTCHALMLPPYGEDLGRCFALLEITTNLTNGHQTRRIISAQGHQNTFWGWYAWHLSPILSKVAHIDSPSKHVGNETYEQLFIGDVPVCAMEDDEKTLISCERFQQL